MNLEAFAAIAQEYPELKAIFDGIGEIKSKIEIATDDAEKTTMQANERYEDATREYEASLKAAQVRRDEAESHERELNTQLALIAAFCSILVKQKSEFREDRNQDHGAYRKA
jgi:F0F1-type ATP synthase epsilon subunit